MPRNDTETFAYYSSCCIDEHADRYGDLFTLGNQIILGVFILEAAVKMIALAPKPQRYFLDGCNVFDFAIIV